MKLLLVTQTVDQGDPTLGFFHAWIVELATRFEAVHVVCLYRGSHDLPANVRVHSLGKEEGTQSKTAYVVRFLKLAWQLRKEYDAVFVHMNQEYVLLTGWLWKLLGKRVYMWRNHYAGSWLTGLAAAFCTKIFCTSKSSYTARYAKTVFMPVGVDTGLFYPDPRVRREPASILFLARMSPSKRPEVLIEALETLDRKGIAFTTTFAGSPLPEHAAYHASLRERVERSGLSSRVTFLPGPTRQEAPDLYRTHDIFVNCSPPGMYDKTLFEAAACGCFVLAANEDFSAAIGEGVRARDAGELAARLEGFLTGKEDRKPVMDVLATLVHEHALTGTMERLARELT